MGVLLLRSHFCCFNITYDLSYQGKETLIGVSITDMQVCKKYHGQSVFTDVRSNSIHFVVVISKIVMHGGQIFMQDTANGLQRRLATMEEKDCASASGLDKTRGLDESIN